MWVCEDCFADEEIRHEIVNNSAKVGICDVCKKKGHIIELSYFSEFFEKTLSLFQSVNKGGGKITEILDADWNLFDNENCARKILNEILSSGHFDFGFDDNVSYKSDIVERISAWQQLKSDVTDNYRFFVDHEKFDEYFDLSPDVQLTSGNFLYRARIIPEGKTRLKSAVMGCPPKEKATAGRANPMGIPYLYLCKAEKTTYFEVRAGYMDKLSIGRFRIIRNLNIVDFSSKISLFVSYDGTKQLSDVVVKKKMLDAISFDLSKPLCRYDTELEYVPTQLICEYCKRNGADGVCFNSSLHKGGLNYVIFNPNDAECVHVSSRQIKTIDVDV